MGVKKQDWQRPAVLAAILVALIAYTLFRSAPERSSVDRLEAQLAGYPIETLQNHEPGRVAEYVRYYAEVKPRAEGDLPFTTMPAELSFRPGQRLIAGVLVSPEVARQFSLPLTRPGIRRVARADLPEVSHGGCQVVNVVYDPRRDEVVGAWCNVDGVDPVSGTPPR